MFSSIASQQIKRKRNTGDAHNTLYKKLEFNWLFMFSTSYQGFCILIENRSELPNFSYSHRYRINLCSLFCGYSWYRLCAGKENIMRLFYNKKAPRKTSPSASLQSTSLLYSNVRHNTPKVCAVHGSEGIPTGEVETCHDSTTNANK